MTARLLVAVALAAAVSPAAAQSRRYPPPADDPDDGAERASRFWAAVADPDRARYDRLVRDALLTVRADRRRATELLREATALRPELITAWGYLGLFADQVRDWAGCADGYGRAAALDPTWRPDPALPPGIRTGVALAGRRGVVVAHAVCRTRAGDVAGAIASLQAVIARGEAGLRGDSGGASELWLRLGESYLAAGHLDDAASAFTEALTLTGRREPEAAWLRAVALDRGRRTAEAETAAAEAQRYDRGAGLATSSNRPPPITPGEREYLLGLAALTAVREPTTAAQGICDSAAPACALIYFRRFLEVAPADSPWRARATEHLTAVEDLDLASLLTVTGGDLGERAAVERAVRARLPALRACLAPLPSLLAELRITQHGPTGVPPRRPAATPPPPPTPRGAVRRPTYDRLDRSDRGERDCTTDAEQPGVSASWQRTFDGQTAAAREDALECVERVAASLALPRPPAGSCATVRVPLVAP